MGRRTALLAMIAGAVLAAASPSRAQAPGARPFDGLTGMLLYCTPVLADPWTRGLCDSLNEEATRLARIAKVPFVVLETKDSMDDNKAKAKAVGFDSANALWVLAKVERLTRVEKGWGLNLQANGIHLPQPQDNGQQRRAVFVQGATFDATIRPHEARAAGKTLLEGFFNYYTAAKAKP